VIDIKLLRENKELFSSMLVKRNTTADLSAILELDKKKLTVQRELEEKRKLVNQASAKIGQLAKEKKDISSAKAEVKVISDSIADVEAEFRQIDEKLKSLLLGIPNTPLDSVPDGKSEDDNPEIRKWGQPREFHFKPKSHLEIGEALGILDFKRAVKLSGARFALYFGNGARLERALTSFMLDTHTANGYKEVLPPFIVTAETMTGTGQLPKFKEDLFKIEGLEHYLIPTAEVPITNIHAGEILSADELPKKFTAYTPCFRSEAGSYGKIATGLIRQHQFNKVEMVKLVKPEDSLAELESLTADAESILQKLELPYRVVELCGGDLGFSSAKTYDLEVWLPSQKRFVEISSCSTFTDFQARRMAIRFRREAKSKPELVHTINGSGLAVGRTFVAILENFQNEDGSVSIPKALQGYMGGLPEL